MRYTSLTIGCAALAMAGCSPSNPGNATNESFTSYLASGAKISAVIKRNGDQLTWSSGGGVYIGNGLILTASHIVKGAKNGDVINIAIDESLTTGVLISQFVDFAGGNNDLAVIKINSLAGASQYPPAIPVCTKIPATSAGLLVISFRFLAVAPMPIIEQESSIQGLYEHGNSGSAIIDPSKKCIAGIASFSDVLVLKVLRTVGQVTSISRSGNLNYTPSPQIVSFLDSLNLPYQKQ